MKVKGQPDGYCSRFFSALANRLRIRILQQLTIAPMTVNELSARLGSERTLVSHNLAILVKAELAEYVKEGKSRVYSANAEVMPYVFFLMDRIVCAGCSIKRTCIVLREREAPLLPSIERKTCAGCR